MNALLWSDQRRSPHSLYCLCYLSEKLLNNLEVNWDSKDFHGFWYNWTCFMLLWMKGCIHICNNSLSAQWSLSIIFVFLFLIIFIWQVLARSFINPMSTWLTLVSVSFFVCVCIYAIIKVMQSWITAAGYWVNNSINNLQLYLWFTSMKLWTLRAFCKYLFSEGTRYDEGKTMQTHFRNILYSHLFFQRDFV